VQSLRSLPVGETKTVAAGAAARGAVVADAGANIARPAASTAAR
jgi:hypothetical protein